MVRLTTSRAHVAGAVIAALMLALAPVAAAEPVTAHPPFGADPTGIGNPFREHNGIIDHFVRDPEGYDGFANPPTPWTSITEQIESGWFADRGIHTLLIYGPWKSTKHFLGLPPLDYFDVQVGTGTLAVWDAMAAAAKAADMPILIYLELIYSSPQSPVFQKAAQYVIDGVDSFERRLFRWDERPQPQAECPPSVGMPGPLTWTSHPSIADGRCYVQAWGELAQELPIGFPAFDFERPEAMAYAKRVIGFWIDHGVDGFLYDAVHTYLGMHDPWGDPVHLARQRELHIDFVREHLRPDGTRALGWTSDEGEFGDFSQERASDLVGFTHTRVQGGDDFDSYPVRAMQVSSHALPVADLEDHWATWVDPRRQAGRGSMAALIYGDDLHIPPSLRVLDAALQAGGIGADYHISYQHHLPDMAAATQERVWDVFRTIERSPALAPGASRERLPSVSAAGRELAFLRHSMDGTRSALALFNLDGTEQCVSVDLSGSGIAVPQTATDLATGAPGPELASGVTNVRLPGWGYLFLDVQAGPGFPWTVIDSTADGWRTGDGWAVEDDPSAFGGTRIGGAAPGGWAELVFRGRSIQGWGRMGVLSAEEVEVFVDGVSHGVHSQRRRPPIERADVFQGQRLFSIGALDAGEHTLRLVQVAESGEAGIDYVRVSDEAWTDPTAPVVPAGDACG